MQDVFDLYRSGQTCAEIAESFGVFSSTVHRWLKKLGVVCRKRGHRKGRPSWNKGMVLSLEMKKCLNLTGLELGRAWNKGKVAPYSKDTLRKMRKSHIGQVGELASNWQGGISRIYKTGYNSLAYKQWRKSVFERDNYQCQKCGTASGHGRFAYLTAHHIKSFAKYPELRFEVSNGITLCELCHCKEDKYRAHFMKMEAANV
jgi:hypothetical protein